MAAEHRIILNYCSEKCFAEIAGGAACKILVDRDPGCGSCACPFYKPKGCDDWIRIQDGNRISILPPEEYIEGRQEHLKRMQTAPVWRIVRRRI